MIVRSYSAASAMGDAAKIVREMIDRAHHRIRGEAPERAKRSELHRVAEVGDQLELLLRLDVLGDLVERLDAARRTDAAGRALAAALNGAEFHGEARLLQHVGRVVEHDDAGMADQPVLGGEGFVVEGRVEERAREIGAERTADLHRFHRPAGGRAAADVVDDLAERQAEGRLVEAAMLDVPGDLQRDRAARAAHAEIPVEAAPLSRMIGTEASEITLLMTVGLSKGPCVPAAAAWRARRRACLPGCSAARSPRRRHRRRRRLGLRCRRHGRTEHVDAQHARLASDLDRLVHRRNRMRIFRAHIDEALGRAGREPGDRHAFDQHEGIALHDHAVGECAAVAFVGIADDVFAVACGIENGLPLDAGREARAAASAKARIR